MRMKERRGTVPLGVIYFFITTGMYYFNWQYFSFGIHILYKILLALFIISLSFVVFLVHTDLERAGILGRYVCLLSLPQIVVLIVSMPLWVLHMQGMTAIRRGAFEELYGIIMIFAMAGILYVFGENGFWLNLVSMLAANFARILGILQKNGLSVYLKELGILIRSFAGETGSVIAAAEIHELTFAIGLCLSSCLMDWKRYGKDRKILLLLPAALFCFFSGFKRIGILAMALSLSARLILKVLTGEKDRRKGWLMFAAFCVSGLLFGYLCLVKGGIYEFLTKRFALNTMGRRELSRYIDAYYWIGPDYIGYGAGFVSRMFSNMATRAYGNRALHNDILLLYIDLGFWGFWIWIFSAILLRTWVIYKWQGIRSGILCLCATLFLMVTATTDNTIYYVYVTGSLAMVIMNEGYKNQRDCAGL